MDISKSIEYKLDFSASVYLAITQRVGIIDTFKGAWGALGTQQSGYLKELKNVATIESIGSSTRIEGATLTDKEVAALLKKVKVSKLSTRDEQEVAGYYEALQIILDNFGEIELSQRYIHQLHSILLKFSEKDHTHKGRYKTVSNQVVANYPDGSKRTIFRTTEPHLTDKEMADLIEWTNNSFKAGTIHPLLVITIFIYEFLSIHPYQDGNGRLSRLLTTLLLLRMGYSFAQYISFEHVIEKRKNEYYGALMDGQKNRNKKSERINNWILFFMDCLIVLIKRLEAKYETYNKLSKNVNQRQLNVLEFIRQKKIASVGEVEAGLTEYSRNTLKKDLSYLVKEQLVIKTGEKKGTRYHINKNNFDS